MSPFARIRSLQDAHLLIQGAFLQQLDWWGAYVPFINFGVIRRRGKLLRIGQYLLDQKCEAEKALLSQHIDADRMRGPSDWDRECQE